MELSWIWGEEHPLMSTLAWTFQEGAIGSQKIDELVGLYSICLEGYPRVPLINSGNLNRSIL